MIQAIIFDCFGVLTTDLWRAFLDELPDGTDIEPLRELNRALDAGLITRDEFVAQIHEQTGKYPPIVEHLSSHEVIKNTQLLGYIRELKQTYKIGLLSNISSNWVRDELLTEDEQDLFDVMILSHDVGMVKPNPDIYLLAAERLAVEPSACVFIDDAEGHCAGARAIGMQAIVYKDFKQTREKLSVICNQ